MHYTAVEEIHVGEVITAGMFLVNKHPAIVLFQWFVSFLIYLQMPGLPPDRDKEFKIELVLGMAPI